MSALRKTCGIKSRAGESENSVRGDRQPGKRTLAGRQPCAERRELYAKPDQTASFAGREALAGGHVVAGLGLDPGGRGADCLDRDWGGGWVCAAGTACCGCLSGEQTPEIAWPSRCLLASSLPAPPFSPLDVCPIASCRSCASCDRHVTDRVAGCVRLRGGRGFAVAACAAPTGVLRTERPDLKARRRFAISIIPEHLALAYAPFRRPLPALRGH